MRGIRLTLVVALALAAQAVAGSSAALATSWSVQSTPSPPGADNSLLGISCPSDHSCLAVGGGDDGANAESWNGTSWTLLHPRNHGNMDSGLDGVSCVSPKACMAVGHYTPYYTPGAPSRSGTVSERWNGKNWTLLATPNPAGSRFAQLSEVSCVRSGVCIAVGYAYGRSGHDQTLAERWNGRKWVILPTPKLPRGGHDGELLGVSCTSTRWCAAVGSYQVSHSGSSITTSEPLAELFAGRKWVIQRIPRPANQLALTGVSCASRSACTAVGFPGSSFGTHLKLAERWDGRRWTIQSVPSPSGSNLSELWGVSCPAKRACTAAGDYSDPMVGDDVPLAERWNGTGWAVQSTPPMTTEGTLAGVSCPSTNACFAVGHYVNGSDDDVVLAERYS